MFARITSHSYHLLITSSLLLSILLIMTCVFKKRARGIATNIVSVVLKVVGVPAFKAFFLFHRCLTEEKLEMPNPRVVVVGSCMIDLVSYAPRLPRAGETLTGKKFHRGYGGKGANQCVAAARLGADTALVARIGDDTFGQEYLEALDKEGINTDHVSITEEMHTGMAQITVADSGQNQIIIVPGANTNLSLKDILAAKLAIEEADVLLFQMETPLETTLKALDMAKGKGKRIVNAAPASKIMDSRLFTESDIFCVNEVEAEELCKFPVQTVEDAIKAVKKFVEFGCKTVVVTLGSHGAVFISEECPSPCHIPAEKVQALDTTGAGDAFLGAMAYYLAYQPHLTLKEVIYRACSIATITVQAKGTQTSFPYRQNLPTILQ